MTTLLLLPLIAYSINELRAVRRRERKLWAVIAEMAGRIDDMSVEVGLLPVRQTEAPREPAPAGGGAAEALAGSRHLRVVNGGK